MVTLLSDRSDIGVVRIFSSPFGVLATSFKGGVAGPSMGPPAGVAPPPGAARHYLQREPPRQAPVLRSVHRSLELLRQGPDLRKVRLQAQAPMR